MLNTEGLKPAREEEVRRLTNRMLPPQILSFAARHDARIGPFNVVRTYCEIKWLIATGQAQLLQEYQSSIGTLLHYKMADQVGDVYKPRWNRLIEQHLEDLIRKALEENKRD